MRAYVIRRLLLMIPTLGLVTVIVFLLVRFIPGDVIDMMLAEMSEQSGMGAELTEEYLQEAMGLDQPMLVQYGRWLGVWPNKDGAISGIFQGDLGESLWKNKSISEELLQRLPVSLELGLISITTGWLIAIPIGVNSAIRQDTPGDYVGRTMAILAISVPSFWVATMVIVYPSIWWGWTPSLEYIPIVKDLGGNLVQFGIPGILMGMMMSGTTMRMTRTMMLEVMRQDYIRTAWSKGLQERTIIVRHAMKNALIPVVTIAGMMIPVLIGGTVITEQIFCLPGVGRFMFEALNQRDYPIISGINLVLATVVLLANLLVDVTYAWLDPRVQYG
ncbi:ABC transporter permease [Chloroflexota bacterium]